MHNDASHKNQCTRQLTFPLYPPVGAALPLEALTAALKSIPGVRYAFVSAQTEMGWLIYDPETFCIAKATAAVVALGCGMGAPTQR